MKKKKEIRTLKEGEGMSKLIRFGISMQEALLEKFDGIGPKRIQQPLRSHPGFDPG
jgi:hypothetical protein